MSGTRSISQLAPAQTVADADIVPITQSVNGTLITNGATMQQVLDYIVQQLTAMGLIGG